jgi:trehalose 6-phosphate synthase
MSRILWNSDVSRWAATFIKDLAASKASKGRSKMALAKKESDNR